MAVVANLHGNDPNKLGEDRVRIPYTVVFMGGNGDVFMYDTDTFGQRVGPFHTIDKDSENMDIGLGLVPELVM